MLIPRGEDEIRWASWATRPTETIQGVSRSRTRTKDPMNQTVLISFVDLSSMFRSLVPSLSSLAVSLNKRFEKSSARHSAPLISPKKDTVENFKTVLMNPLILVLPRRTVQYAVDTDVCDSQLWCVLPKEQENGTVWPIGRWSRTPTCV